MCKMNRPMFSVVAIAMMLASSVWGQGTTGSLPGPVNSQELGRYADRLGLSDAQRLAIEPAHDAYRAQFRLLREGEIAAFLREQQGAQGGIPERDVVADLIRKVKRIQARIAMLDNSLFDQLVPILSEEQQVRVSRVRMARERKRYAAQQTAAALGRQTVDLSEMMLDADVPSQFAEQVDSTLSTYERRLTTIMRKQYEAILNQALDTMDMLAERGYVNLSQEEIIQDPDLLQDVLAQMQEVYPVVAANVAALSVEIRELNGRTIRLIAALLPDDAARRARDAYHRQAYPQLAAVIDRAQSDWITRSLRLDSLTADQRALLEQASAALQKRIDALFADGAGKLDAFFDGLSPFNVNTESANQLGTDLGDLWGEMDAAVKSAEETVLLALGEEAVTRIRHATSQLEAPARVERPSPEPTRFASPMPTIADRFAPRPIGRRDIDRYVQQLQVEGDLAEVLETIHSDYAERLHALEVLERLRSAGQGIERASAEQLDRLDAARRQSVEAFVTADATFFDDLSSIVTDEKAGLLDLVRRTRQRRAYSGSASTDLALGTDMSNEAGVDVVAVVLDEQPTDAELARLSETFDAYEEQALAAFQARFEAQLDLQRMNDQWLSEITEAANRDLSEIVELQLRYQEAMKAPTARVTQTDQMLVDLNRRTIESVLSLLSPERAHTMQRAYDHAAYPSVYNDAASVHRHLSRSLELDDLTPNQREQLTDLGASYRPEYERLTREMIPHLSASRVNVVGLDTEDFQVWQRAQQELTKIRFDRNELNGRSITRMKTILSEDQIRRLGGLPEPLGEDDLFLYR